MVCLVENAKRNSTYPLAFLHFVYCEQENNKNSEYLIFLLGVGSCETLGSSYTAGIPFGLSSMTTFSILDRQTGQEV